MKELISIKNKYLKILEVDNFDFQKFNHFAIVHHSNSIEGSTLTKEETFLLLEENLTPKNKPLEHSLMAIDHLNALKYVIDLADKKEKLTVDNIQKLSSLIMKTTGSEINSMAGSFNSAKGDFRKLTVRAGTTTFMDYKKVPHRVEDLVNFINENIAKSNEFIDCNNLAFDSHFQIVSIHPFADGNGRLSRLLMNYIQQYCKQPLTVVFKEDKQDYIDALTNTRKLENIGIFRKFMFSQTKKYIQIQIKELSNLQKLKKNKGNGMSFLF